MKFLLAAPLALLPGQALAHPGHVAMAAGHSHTFFEIAVYAMALIIVGTLILFVYRNKSNG